MSEHVASKVERIPFSIVNAYMIGPRENWVLVDAGLPTSAKTILKAVKKVYNDMPPKAILLTHGHFDHVGALQKLLKRWNTPVYSHQLELPYLIGQAYYPHPDPDVGGGMMAKLSPLFSNAPINLGKHIHLLPDDGSVPFLDDWRYLHTPGHSPGHVSFFRDKDKVLIAGDAFTTTRQEGFWSSLTKPLELHGPPMYFTPDWVAAKKSVEKLAELEPNLALTGHGKPMRGEALRHSLHKLANNFDELAVPRQGRYVPRDNRLPEAIPQ